MHLVIGFESQVDAQAVVGALARAARTGGADIAGAALARCDVDSGIHLEVVHGYAMPQRALLALGSAVDKDACDHVLRPGDRVLVVAVSSASELVPAGELAEHGALWIEAVPPELL